MFNQEEFPIFVGKASGHNYDFPLSWTDEPYVPSTQKYKNAKVLAHMSHTIVFLKMQLASYLNFA